MKKFLKFHFLAMIVLATLVVWYSYQFLSFPELGSVASPAHFIAIIGAAVFARYVFIIYPRAIYMADEFYQALVIAAVGALVLKFGETALIMQLASTIVFVGTLLVAHVLGTLYFDKDVVLN